MATAGSEIKICGLVTQDDAMAALDLGADYLGFVLYAKSPRGISPTKLFGILDKVDGIRNAVGVFVNRPRAEVARIVSDCGLCAAQIHGDEAADEFQGLAWPVWRAVGLKAGNCRPDPADWPATRYVVDAAVTGLYGGTGKTADWAAAADLAARHPVMLAGGLTPDNVGDAIRTVRPVGVDVASGVEAEPGRKDLGKMRAFIQAARSA